MRRGCSNSNNKSIKSQTKNTAILNRFPPSNISQRPPGPALSSKQRSSFLFFSFSLLAIFQSFPLQFLGKLRGLLQANYTIYTLMAPRRQLYRSSSPSPSRRVLCSCCCCCCCPSLPDDWGKVRLRNFHKQHEALLEEVFASSIGWLHVARLLPMPVPVPVCRYFLGPLATSACRLSVCPNCVCALGQRCQRARHQLCLQSVPVASSMGVLGYLCMCILIVSWCVYECASLCVSQCVCKWVTGHVVLCHNREDPVYSAKEMLPLLQSQFSCGSVHELSLIETTTAMI